MNVKNGLELKHLTSLKELKAHPNLDILTEYQKWIDEHIDLADVIMGMCQLNTSSENADVEDKDMAEHMSAWVDSLTI